jgi:ABC-2 type transport system permease protein
MKQFFSFVKKEFLHMIRDPRSLLILLGMPIAQILIFGFALTNEVKNSRIAIFDPAQDVDSKAIIQKMDASQYFDVVMYVHSIEEIENAFRRNEIKMAMVFEPEFRENLNHANKASIQLITDTSDPNTGTTVANYATNIIQEYQRQLSPISIQPSTYSADRLSISVEARMLYNPQLRGEYNFVPGVMAMILMLISAMMTSVGIVRERELGTMEIMLVSPMRPLMVILSKTVPYMVLSIINFITIMVISVFILHLPIRGSLALLFGVSLLYIFCSLALGILISTVAKSQQVAMLISLMGLMMPTLLFSGFMFPLENLPKPMQVLANVVPAKWYFVIVKNVMLKGLDFSSIWFETSVLAFMTLFFLGLSFKKFKIRLA